MAIEGVEFDSLVKDILNNPEKILDETITPEQLIAIQKHINPYMGLKDSSINSAIAISYTNLKENYIKRLMMTSIIGFLFLKTKTIAIRKCLLMMN